MAKWQIVCVFFYVFECVCVFVIYLPRMTRITFGTLPRMLTLRKTTITRSFGHLQEIKTNACKIAA